MEELDRTITITALGHDLATTVIPNDIYPLPAMAMATDNECVRP